MKLPFFQKLLNISEIQEKTLRDMSGKFTVPINVFIGNSCLTLYIQIRTFLIQYLLHIISLKIIDIKYSNTAHFF